MRYPIYKWISCSTPKTYLSGRTIKELKSQPGFMHIFRIVRIAFRFETVYCAVFDNELLTTDGSKGPVITTKALRVSNGDMQITRIAGINDPYALMNEIGVERDLSTLTDIGQYWIGALLDDARSLLDETFKTHE